MVQHNISQLALKQFFMSNDFSKAIFVFHINIYGRVFNQYFYNFDFFVFTSNVEPWFITIIGVFLVQYRTVWWSKGPSINYVVSKSAIFDPLPPPLSSFLLSRVYLVNRLWGYPPPPLPTETT